jgi:acetyltransferase-like isoleucine patch superfamily enzyme
MRDMAEENYAWDGLAMTKAPKKFSRTAVRILSAFIPSKSGRKTFRFRHSKMPAARPSNPRVCMNGQGNLVILRREEGEWINDFSMLADKLEVNINGEGNSIVLQRPPKICSSFRLFVDGNGTTIEIGPDADIGFLEARLFRGDGQRITIGRNCHFGHVELIVGDDTSLEIGNDCIFSRFIVIRTSDGHSILDMDGRILNYPHRRPVIKIGDNCWIGEHVMFTKNASTPPPYDCRCVQRAYQAFRGIEHHNRRQSSQGDKDRHRVGKDQAEGLHGKHE